MADEETPREFRKIPTSDLDFNLMTTDTVWGKNQDIPIDLRTALEQYYQARDADGKVTGTYKKRLWGLLGFYTRDMRLGNLTEKNGELAYVHYYLDLANDMLQAEMVEPFLICLSRAATRLELSQSKMGFLRKQMNTFRQESTYQELEPPKKSLFGMAKGGKGI